MQAKMMRLVLLATCLAQATAFVPFHQNDPSSSTARFMTRDNEAPRRSFPNPFKEVKDMLSNFDDVVDDFFYKRMGNGEVFYGKRKYKPSGNVEGEYKGMGLTDSLKIDIARERKEQFLEEKLQKEEEEMQQK